MTHLPIRDILPDIRETLNCNSAVVIHAPPGSGKTTVVPLELLSCSFLGNKKIVMLEPRRLAATNAARWMASQLGEGTGQTVGYTIRFDRKISSSTRIEVVTEGVLNRRLHGDPLLEDVGIVIFDEFHERNLYSDVALALCYDLQKGLREDLKIVVMSATVDTDVVSRMLDDAPVVSCSGTIHPVKVRYVGDHVLERTAETVADTVRAVLTETQGDILAFLPGGQEIRSCERLLHNSNLPSSPMVVPLYGDLPFAAQERAILPASKRKVVLTTNIAETSVTIEGVSVVVDSGWVRQVRYDPVAGLDRMLTARVSAASAEQRKGRAGRLGPGTCYRLWSEHTQHGLVPFASPEILVSDLSQLALDLASWGVREAESLRWIDPPPPASLASARAFLQNLGALDPSCFITPDGRMMASMPLHPRLAHLLLQGKEKGIEDIAVDLAALLSVRDILRNTGKKEATSSDIVDRLEVLWEWRQFGHSRDRRGDDKACHEVERVARFLSKNRQGKGGSGSEIEGAVSFLLVSAFPDRLAQRREHSSNRYLLANGRGVVLSGGSGVHSPEYLVGVRVDGGESGDGTVYTAHSIQLEWIRRHLGPKIKNIRRVLWSRERGKTVVRIEEKFLGLVLSSTPVEPFPDELIQGTVEAVRTSGLEILRWSPAARLLRDRVRFLARHFPHEQWPDLSDDHLLRTLEDWLKPWLVKIKPDALHDLDVHGPLLRLLNFNQKRRLDEGAPTHLTVPSGSMLPIDYSGEGPPILAVKLQEMFGLGDTPRIAWGSLPIQLHLLSPARRPLQVTQDLGSFWKSAYPEIRKELKGRYPKHPWPEDPWSALPTRHTKNAIERK